MAKVTTPPTPLPERNYPPILFLAGSIEQDSAARWQDRVVEALSDLNVQILNPRREEWDSSWEQIPTNSHFRGQVEWELDGLDKADIIIVYFDPNTKSPITLLELGLFADTDRLRVCCPEGFWRRGNVQIVCERKNILMFETLESLVENTRNEIKLKSMIATAY